MFGSVVFVLVGIESVVVESFVVELVVVVFVRPIGQLSTCQFFRE